MSKKIIVYEALVPTNDGRDFMYYKLEPLLTNLRKMWNEANVPKRHVDDIFQCPAFQRSLTNTFVYKSPYDLSITYDENKRYKLSIPSRLLDDDHTARPVDEKTGIEDNHIIQIFTSKANKFFFADSSCDINIESPSFHNTSYCFLSGSFNIGKWFRPIHPAILNFGQKDIHIKRGDPLLYLKFPKDVKIEIRRTYLGPIAYNLSMGCGGYKTYDKKAPFEKLYKYFEQMANKKGLLKELEQNRID